MLRHPRALGNKPIKLVDFIRDAKADNASQLIARLSRLLYITFGYSLSLKDQIGGAYCAALSRRCFLDALIDS
jgi:hypothetical protein